MADVKWIKLYTDMFDNKKIKHLRRLSEGNNIVLLWIMLLTMAGQCNAGGAVFLTEDIPYTAEMLADDLGFGRSTVTRGLEALSRLNMVGLRDGFYTVTGWEEYQNTDKLTELREYNRIAQQKSREKRKLASRVNDMSMTCQPCQGTDIEEEREEDKEREEEGERGAEAPASAAAFLKANGKHNNVFLTDEQYKSLRTMFPDHYDERIERFGEYMAKNGKSYSNHYEKIVEWAKADNVPTEAAKPRSYDLDAFFEAAVTKGRSL